MCVYLNVCKNLEVWLIDIKTCRQYVVVFGVVIADLGRCMATYLHVPSSNGFGTRHIDMHTCAACIRICAYMHM